MHAHIYPATGQPNAAVSLAGAAEIDRAVASAWDAHREWMSLTVDRRRDLLIDLADAVQRAFAGTDMTLANFVPLGRHGGAEEVADFISYLLSDKASYLTGTAHSVDGGFVTA